MHRKTHYWGSSIKNSDLTENSIFIFNELYTEFLNLELRIGQYTKKLLLISKQNESCKRLMSIPGIGEITSTALISSIGKVQIPVCDKLSTDGHKVLAAILKTDLRDR
ncbi:TPA: transposase [Legionella anisa]